MIESRATTFGLILAFVLQAHTLSVIQGSPCFDTCAGNNPTASGDIVCTDHDFASTDSGKTLSGCLTCLHGSDYRNGFMTDSNLFLYYLSTIQQSCLGNSDATSSCSSKCASLATSFPNNGMRNLFQNPFSYCTANDNAYTNSATDCATCLQSNEESVILGNIVHVGDVGCQTTPQVQQGEQLEFFGNLFNATELDSSSAVADSTSTFTGETGSTASASQAAISSATTATTPTSSITVVLTATVAFNPSATAESANSNSDHQAAIKSATLSRGAAAGIGIALGLVGIVAIIVFAILLRRRLLRKGSEFKRMPSPEMAKRSATPPAAGVFVPPGHKSSSSAAAAAAVGAFARAGIGESIAKEKNGRNVAADDEGPKHSKSFKSVTSKSWKSKNITPRTSIWFYAANPKRSSELTALPQPAIVPGMDGIPEMPSSRGTEGRGWD